MKDACVVAGGQSKWGYRDATLIELFQEAGKACFEDNPHIKPADIDGILVASACSERLSRQTHLAPMVAEYLGIKTSSVCARVELLCGSGSSAIILAAGMIKSGLSNTIMVIGGEKLFTPQRWETFYSQLGSVDHDWDGAQGLGLPPSLLSIVFQRHADLYGTTEEQLAAISVKNRRNGLNNPKGQFRKEITLQEAMTAKPVAAPLKLYDCCPITDGAAAVILTSGEAAKDFTDKPLVKIIGTAQATESNSISNRGNWTTWNALKTAASRAYSKAGITADDVDVAQTHDCFTISEVIEYEDLGFCEKGEGGLFAEKGLSDFGGKVAVNTDGGLLSCGHPFGGTGIRQAIEIAKQLKGDAAHQVEDAKYGLTHNFSGAIVAHTILIYGRD